MKPIGWFGLVGLLLILLAFAWFVWPTPYEYVNLFGLPIRTNRFTGKDEIWTPQWGYLPREELEKRIPAGQSVRGPQYALPSSPSPTPRRH